MAQTSFRNQEIPDGSLDPSCLMFCIGNFINFGFNNIDKSIFLADTDSDNYSDLEEVNSVNDPICPTNQDCNLLALITPKTNLASVVQEVAMNPNLTIEQAAFREFRKFLLDNGMKQEEVDGLTDDDLFYIFSILNEAESGQNVDPQDMSAAEVKAFLLSQSSADKKAIEALSDEELLNIGKKLVNQ